MPLTKDKRRRTFRHGRRGGSVSRHVYPTEYALKKRGTEPPRPTGIGSENYTDDRATRCAQCGVPIENIDAQTECPLCGSDNFRGDVFY